MDPVASRAIAGYAQAAAPATGRSELAPEAQQGEDFASFFQSLAQRVGQAHARRASRPAFKGSKASWTRSPWSRRSRPPSSPCKP